MPVGPGGSWQSESSYPRFPLSKFQRFQRILTTITAFLTITGIITFTNFILEEAIQTTIFGTWQAGSTKDWPLLYKGVRVVDSINDKLRTINNLFGWIHPFAYVSYDGYVQATDYWVEATTCKILQSDPTVVAGHRVTFDFRPETITSIPGQTVMSAGQITVISDKPPTSSSLRISATPRLDGNRIIFETLNEGGL